MSDLSIGQLARRAGVAIDTVRYYERNHLLAPAGRLASGYRRYGDHELKTLRFIRRAKALGFTLADIRELLSLSDQRSVPLDLTRFRGHRVFGRKEFFLSSGVAATAGLALLTWVTAVRGRAAPAP